MKTRLAVVITFFIGLALMGTAIGANSTTSGTKLSTGATNSLTAIPEQISLSKASSHLQRTANSQGLSGSHNVELVGQIGGSAFAIAVQGNYAYVGIGPSLIILDISNPAQLIRAGQVILPDMVNGVVVAGGYAYIADYDAGLRVIDVSNPAVSSEVGFVDTPGYAVGVTVAGNYAYIADDYAGLRVIDVSNPTVPFEVGYYDTPGSAGVSVTVVEGYAYMIAGGLRVIDVSNPNSPTQEGYLGISTAQDVAVANGYAYVAAGYGGLRVIDVSNPTSPNEVGVSGSALYFASSVTVTGSYAYVVAGYGGLQIIDLSDPTTPTEIGSYIIPLGGDVVVAENYAYVSAGGYGGLRVIDVGNPIAPTETGFFTTPQGSLNVAVTGGYAYVADGGNGLRVIDVNNPIAPTEVGFYATSYQTYGVAVAGDYAYISDNNAGLRVIDVSDPNTPIEMSHLVTVQVGDVVVTEDYAYVAGGSLQVIDVSDPTAPAVISSFNVQLGGVAIAGNYVYVVGGALWVIDVSNPAAPTEVGYYDIPGFGHGVAVVGDYAYVAAADAGMWVIDITNPAAPIEVGYYDTPGNAMDMAVVGNYAYVAAADAGMRVIDITNPAAPIEVGYYDTPGNAMGVAVTEDYAYVADSNGGLFILRYAHPTFDCDVTLAKPIMLITGWGGSEGTFELSDDDQLQYFEDPLGDLGYVEGCNLFYATGTSPYLDLDENAELIYYNLCAAYAQIKAQDPSWDGYFDIIAHSYGGLRARAYLENDHLYGEPCPITQGIVHVDNLFTMGTPHGGEPYPFPNDLLPFAGIIGICAVVPSIPILCDGGHGGPQWPALYEMLPSTRDTQNKASNQPDNVSYYLLAGDARLQDLPPLLATLWATWGAGFPSVLWFANDFAVHQSSATILFNNYNSHYPRIIPIYNHDLHGQVPPNLAIGGNPRSYVNPSTTFMNQICPHIGQIDCPSLPERKPADTSTAIVTELTELNRPQSTIPISSVEIKAGILSSNEVVGGQFIITGSGLSQVILSWFSGDLELSLIDPSGSLVNPQTVSNDPNTDYVAFDTGYGLMATYLITTTEVGTWQYTITGYGVNPTTGYRLFAVPSTPIGVSVATPSWLPNNSPVVITATVSYSITVPLVGGTVNAQVNRPDGTSDAVILFDDGNHNDGTSNDGTFGTTYTQTAAGGFYGVVVTATGNYVGENYTRTAWSIMTIGPDNASLTGQYSDAGISDDNDEAYEWLQVTATLSVTEISTYTLSADLYAGETFITHAKTQVPLTPGTQTIALRFDGVDIYSHQLNGPYTVRNVMLLDETGTTILIETADNVHETAPYNYTQFEDGITEIYLPLVWK